MIRDSLNTYMNAPYSAKDFTSAHAAGTWRQDLGNAALSKRAAAKCLSKS